MNEIDSLMEPERWRRLPFNRQEAGRQLTLSESLIKHLTRPSLYWYQAARPAFVLGAAQKPDVLNPTTPGYDVYKRTSGGTVVLVGPDFLSLDVALPPTSRLASGDVTQAYRWFALAWVAALARLGLAARVVEPAQARTARLELDAGSAEDKLVRLVCFGTLSAYEVVAEDGRKLLGLAQVRRRTGSLLQAGVHLRWPAAEFARNLAVPDEQREGLADRLNRQATGLSELLGYRPTNQAIMAAFEVSLTEGWPVRLEPGEWTEEETSLDQAFRPAESPA